MNGGLFINKHEKEKKKTPRIYIPNCSAVATELQLVDNSALEMDQPQVVSNAAPANQSQQVASPAGGPATSGPAPGAVDSGASGQPMASAPQPGPPPNSHGWTQHKTEDGLVYYFNQFTNASTWDV